MVAHLRFGHRRIRRHERSGERTELADDLGMASLNEGAERLRLVRRGHVYLRCRIAIRQPEVAPLSGTSPHRGPHATCAVFAILWPGGGSSRRKSSAASEGTTPDELAR